MGIQGMEDFELPDDFVEEIRQLLDDGERCQWVVGEKIIEGIEEWEPYFIKKKIKNGRALVIRKLAQKTGRDSSTLRDRHNVVAFWKPKMKAEYQVFSWSQLRAVKSAGELWETYAGKAVDNLWSAEKIRYEIAHDKNGQPRWRYWWGKLTDAVDKLWSDVDTPQEIRDLIEDIAGSKLEL